MPASRFSATIVTYRPDLGLLDRALTSLAFAVANARDAGLVADASVFIVDNGPGETLAAIEAAALKFPATAGRIEVIQGHGNVGYGRANNLVLARLASDLHLVMNPDVELEPDAIRAAIAAMHADPRIGAVAPAVRGPAGERQY